MRALLATPPRRVSTSIGISAAFHIALLLLVGTSLYDSGEDDFDIAELSVQLESVAGPNDDFVSVASTAVPLSGETTDTTEAPGLTDTLVDTEATNPDTEIVDSAPVGAIAAVSALSSETNSAVGNVLTTTAESDFKIAIDTETTDPVRAVDMPSTEQAMLEKSVLELTQNLLEQEKTESEMSWQQQGRPYTAKVTRHPAADSTGLEQVVAEIYTEKNGKRMRTTLKMKRLAFSHFTQLVDHWDTMIMLHDDVIDGRFHSNSEINYSFRDIVPRFFGKVTTSSRTLMPDSMGSPSTRKRKDIFRGGYETHTDRISIGSALTGVNAEAVGNGTAPGNDKDKRIRFSEDTRVIFNADGSFVWRAANGKGPLQRVEPNGIYTRYLIGERGAKIYVRGTVVGTVMVYTPSDIEIEGDLIYGSDPRTTLLARDYISLVSGGDIEIAPQRVTGSGDLHVHGALIARRRFIVSEPERGSGDTLYILGSLTAGTLLETEPRYATKVDYDSRFENIRPPSFPMTKRYEVQTWDGNWEAEEAAP